MKRKKKAQEDTTVDDDDDAEDDVDNWVDDEGDEMDDEEARVHEELTKQVDKNREELEALWAASAREDIVEPTEAEAKQGRSAMQKVCHINIFFAVVLTVVQIIKVGSRCARKGPMQKALAAMSRKRIKKSIKMVKRVPTRWNTMRNVVKRALRLKECLKALCAAPQWNEAAKKSRRLRRYFVTEAEWHILQELLPVLEVCSSLVFAHTY